MHPQHTLRQLQTQLTTGPFGTVLSASEYVDGGVPLVNPTHIAAGRILADDRATVGPETAARLGRHRLRLGDLVLGRKGDVGRSALVTKREAGWICGSDSIAVHTNTSVLDPRFLQWVMSSPLTRDLLTSRSNGAAVGGINERVLLDLPVPAPSIDTQRAIAAYLDAETAGIDALLQLRRKQAALNVVRRFEAVRAAMHGRGAGSGRLAWAAGVPFEWPVIHLRWLTTCLDGRRVPVNREDRALMQGDIPYWGANGVLDHVDAALFEEPLVLLGEDGAPFFDREKPKAFFVNTPVWVNNHIHVLRAHGIRPRFLAHYLNLVDYADFVGGSTRDKLTQDDMGSIPVPFPPLAEQERIEQEISVSQRWADEFEAAAQRQIDLLVERRQALITVAVTGDLGIPGIAT